MRLFSENTNKSSRWFLFFPHRTFQCLIILFFLMIAFCPVFSKQGALPFHLSTEEIDRPLVLPAHMWQIHVPVFLDFYFYPSFSYGYTGLVYPIVPPIPRHSITDRFEFIQFPWPYVRYALMQNTEIIEETVRLKGLCVALEGGLQDILYSEQNGFTVETSIRASIKSALGNHFWIQGVLSVYAENLKYLSIALFPDFGYQFTDKIASTLGYAPQLTIYPKIFYKHSIDCNVYINPNPYFGISAGLYTFNGGVYWHIQPNLAFWFQW
jgi:hypothetical protein